MAAALFGLLCHKLLLTKRIIILKEPIHPDDGNAMQTDVIYYVITSNRKYRFTAAIQMQP